MGSLLDLNGVHWFINCSRPSTNASSELEGPAKVGTAVCTNSQDSSNSLRSTSARLLDFGSSELGILPPPIHLQEQVLLLYIFLVL